MPNFKSTCKYKLDSFALSDVGLIREENEDAYRLLHRENCFILADGLGGHRAGEVASAKAVEYLSSAVKHFFISRKNEEILAKDLKSHLKIVLENTNLWIHHLAWVNPDFKGMGTTICSALFHDEYVIYSNIGDSRIYRLRNNTLSQLTKDHLVEYQEHKVDGSTATKQRKILSQAIGTSMNIIPDIEIAPIAKDDLFLLCSDGLSDMLSQLELQSLLSTNAPLNIIGQNLVTQANLRGGKDNITLILIKASDPTNTPPTLINSHLN